MREVEQTKGQPRKNNSPVGKTSTTLKNMQLLVEYFQIVRGNRISCHGKVSLTESVALLNAEHKMARTAQSDV
jgi:hypothetical protein